MDGPAVNLTAACLPALAAALHQAVDQAADMDMAELSAWRTGLALLGRAVEAVQTQATAAELVAWRAAFTALHAATQSPPAAVPPAPAPQTEDEIFANVDATLHAAP